MGTVEERHKEIVELMEKNNKLLKIIAIASLEMSYEENTENTQFANLIAEITTL